MATQAPDEFLEQVYQRLVEPLNAPMDTDFIPVAEDRLLTVTVSAPVEDGPLAAVEPETPPIENCLVARYCVVDPTVATVWALHVPLPMLEALTVAVHDPSA